MSLTATRWAWKVQGLRPLHKLVLLALADRAGEDGEVWPSQEQLTADTSINAKTTWQAIKALKAAGLIEDTGKRRGRTGQVQVLRLRVDRLPDEDAEEFRKRNDSENGSLPFFPSKHSENGIVKHSKNGIRNLPIEPTSESTMRNSDVHDDGFEKFWSAYPKKTAKVEARKAWRKLKPSESLQTSILDDINVRRQCQDWMKDAGRFVPYPATYLNGHRWEDGDAVMPTHYPTAENPFMGAI